MRACARRRFGGDGLDGRRVAVVGLGHVGAALASRLAGDGCELTVSDIDPQKRELAATLGATWAEPEAAMLAECDVLAPCALGGAISAENATALRCAVVCGSANNQLSDESLAEVLAEHGILYARLHRQRRRHDPRVPRDQGLFRGARAGARRGDRGRSRRCSSSRRNAASHRSRRLATELASASTPLCETDPVNELWVVRAGLVAVERGEAGAEGARAGAPSRSDRRPRPAARAPTRLHEGAALDARRAADRRGLVQDAGDRGDRYRPRGSGHLPRSGSAGRLPDRQPAGVGEPRRRPRLRQPNGAGDDRRARRLGRRGEALRRPDRGLGRRHSAPAGDARKIGSIRNHVTRGITTHGPAINVNNDLQPFEWVVPCGIEACRMSSLSRELGAEQDLDRFATTVAARLAEAYGRRPVERTWEEIVGPLVWRSPHDRPADRVAHPRHPLARQPGRGNRDRRAAIPGAQTAVAGTSTGGPTYRRLKRAITNENLHAVSARRRTAQTSASAGSAAPRRS